MIVLHRLKAISPAYIEKWIFSLLIVLLPTQLGKHFWPDWSFVFSLKIDYLAVTVYAWDILSVILGICFLWRKPKLNWWAVGLFVLFLSTSMVSLFFSVNWQTGLSRLINWIPGGFFGIYIASQPANVVRQQILKWLPVAVIGTGVIAFLEVMLGRSVGFWLLGERSFTLATPSIALFNWYGQVFLRPYATFSHPNVLAAFMLLSGLLLIFLSGLKSRFQIIYQLVVIGAVCLSFSRSSIAILLSTVFFFLRKQFLLLIFLFLFFSPLLFARFDSAFNFDQLSLIRREELAETAFAMVREHPLVGVGLNNFIPTAMSSSFISGTSRFLQPVHNIFLLSLSETGLIGLAGFLGFLVIPLFLYWPAGLLTWPQKISIFLVLVFLGIVDHYFLTLPQGQRMLFMLWGIFLIKK